MNENRFVCTTNRRKTNNTTKNVRTHTHGRSSVSSEQKQKKNTVPFLCIENGLAAVVCIGSQSHDDYIP